MYLQVANATNAEPVTDNQTGEQSNQPITALPDVDVVSTTKCVSLCSFALVTFVSVIRSLSSDRCYNLQFIDINGYICPM